MEVSGAIIEWVNPLLISETITAAMKPLRTQSAKLLHAGPLYEDTKVRKYSLRHYDLMSEAIGPSVYVVQSEVQPFLVKIGYASNMVERFRQLEAGSPVRLYLRGTLPGDRALERVLHFCFWDLRHHDEWFYPAPRLVSFFFENSLTPYETSMNIKRWSGDSPRDVIGRERAPLRLVITNKYSQASLDWLNEFARFRSQSSNVVVGDALALLGKYSGHDHAPRSDPKLRIDTPPGQGRRTFEYGNDGPWGAFVYKLMNSRHLMDSQAVTWLALLLFAEDRGFKPPPYRSLLSRKKRPDKFD